MPPTRSRTRSTSPKTQTLAALTSRLPSPPRANHKALPSTATLPHDNDVPISKDEKTTAPPPLSRSSTSPLPVRRASAESTGMGEPKRPSPLSRTLSVGDLEPSSEMSVDTAKLAPAAVDGGAGAESVIDPALESVRGVDGTQAPAVLPQHDDDNDDAHNAPPPQQMDKPWPLRTHAGALAQAQSALGVGAVEGGGSGSEWSDAGSAWGEGGTAPTTPLTEGYDGELPSPGSEYFASGPGGGHGTDVEADGGETDGGVPPPAPKKKSHARKQPVGHIKRARNAFILFRKHITDSNLIPTSVEVKHQNISVVAAKMWKEAPTEVRAKFQEMARLEKEEHARKYPGYRYQPVFRRTDIIRRRVRKDPSEDEKVEAVADALIKGKAGGMLEKEIKEQQLPTPDMSSDSELSSAARSRSRRRRDPGELSKGAQRAQKAQTRARQMRVNLLGHNLLSVSMYNAAQQQAEMQQRAAADAANAGYAAGYGSMPLSMGMGMGMDAYGGLGGGGAEYMPMGYDVDGRPILDFHAAHAQHDADAGGQAFDHHSHLPPFEYADEVHGHGLAPLGYDEAGMPLLPPPESHPHTYGQGHCELPGAWDPMLGAHDWAGVDHSGVGMNMGIGMGVGMGMDPHIHNRRSSLAASDVFDPALFAPPSPTHVPHGGPHPLDQTHAHAHAHARGLGSLPSPSALALDPMLGGGGALRASFSGPSDLDAEYGAGGDPARRASGMSTLYDNFRGFDVGDGIPGSGEAGHSEGTGTGMGVGGEVPLPFAMSMPDEGLFGDLGDFGEAVQQANEMTAGGAGAGRAGMGMGMGVGVGVGAW